MQTKLRFKVIASPILLSLAGVIVSQGYWLKGLYNRLWEQTAVQVEEAMRMAEYKELFLRIEEVTEREKAQRGDIGVPYSKSWTVTNPKPHIKPPSTTSPAELSGPENPVQSEMNVVYLDKVEKENIMDKLHDYLQEIGNVERYIQETMHYEIDSIYPIRYEVYDSLLRMELMERGIRDEYFVEILQQQEGTTERMYISERYENTNQWHPASSEYKILTGIIYRTTLRAPQFIVLKEMGGLLASSVLIFIVILIAFSYLLYTILRQKKP
ncbi:MAG: hypothetical protein LIO97_00055 [Tannerellaceae bacterium]|nr:hypothetical protein [Tannerellaceae bacterium]